MTTHIAPSPHYLNRGVLIEVALFGFTGVLLLAKVWHGVVIFYVHPRYTPLIVVCGIFLLAIAAIRARRIYTRTPDTTHSLRLHSILLALPIILGTFVPARPLGANALQGTSGSSTFSAAVNAPADTNTEQWNLLEWATALSIRGDTLHEKPVDVIGFVYYDPERPLDGFFVARYVITCCTADGNGVHLPVVWQGANLPASDSWVRVQGTLGNTEIAGSEESAIIANQVTSMPRPTSPYLYP